MTPVTFRLSVQQRIYLLVVGGLISALQFAQGNVVLGVVFAVLFVISFFLQGTFKTELDDEGIRSSGGMWPSKELAWDAIDHIEISKLLGTRSVRVRSGADRKRLPAPTDGFLSKDKDFDAKFATIRDAWAGRSRPGSDSSPSERR